MENLPPETEQDVAVPQPVPPSTRSLIGSPSRKWQSCPTGATRSSEGQASRCPSQDGDQGRGLRESSLFPTPHDNGPSDMHAPSSLSSSGLAALLRKGKGPVVASQATRDRSPLSWPCSTLDSLSLPSSTWLVSLPGGHSHIYQKLSIETAVPSPDVTALCALTVTAVFSSFWFFCVFFLVWGGARI